MKNSKLRRILLTLACAVLLVCLSVGATLAYLTSTTDLVTNTFTVGSVTITLDEAKVNEYGVPVDANGKTQAEIGEGWTAANRVINNTYKLIPGHEYTKDPIIHVTKGSEQCWLFVKITDQIAGIQAADTIATQLTANGWTALPNDLVDAEGNAIDTTGVYWHAVVDARNITTDTLDVAVFGEFTLTGDANVSAYNNKTITVKAYAVQADGFNTAALAYAAAPCAW